LKEKEWKTTKEGRDRREEQIQHRGRKSEIKKHRNRGKEKPKFRGLVRQRTIPTERSPLVGVVSTNFSR
jgi:hypothetical protein